VFTPEIFEHIERTPPGRGGEIQLTDAMASLAATTGLNGLVFEGGRYDVGNKLDYLRAVLELALERDDLRDGLRDILATLVEREDLA
jgi:UTP--glucose-1-phosphate uridylyltransferase